MNPRFARARLAVAFTPAEHAEGWSFFRKAAGEETVLSVLAAQQAAEKGGASLPVEALQRLDAFGNRWFPRPQRLDARYADLAERQAMLDALFLNLPQRPLGPGLMFSVPTFVARVRPR